MDGGEGVVVKEGWLSLHLCQMNEWPGWMVPGPVVNRLDRRAGRMREGVGAGMECSGQLSLRGSTTWSWPSSCAAESPTLSALAPQLVGHRWNRRWDSNRRMGRGRGRRGFLLEVGSLKAKIPKCQGERDQWESQGAHSRAWFAEARVVRTGGV